MPPPAIRRWILVLLLALVVAAAAMPAQQMVTETRDPSHSVQDEEFAKSVKQWTTQPYFISPLVDHLPKVAASESPKDVLGYHVGAPAKLTYYADILKYYRALEAALPGRVKVETIGKSDENRELVVVWVSSDENMRGAEKNRGNLARLADPRRSSEAENQAIIATHQAALPPDGRTAQRGDRALGNAAWSSPTGWRRRPRRSSSRFATTSSSRSRRSPIRTAATATSTGSTGISS